MSGRCADKAALPTQWDFACICSSVLLGFQFANECFANSSFANEGLQTKAETGTLDFREVKTDPRRIDLQALGLKIAAFFRKNPDLRRERFGVGGLSLDDM